MKKGVIGLVIFCLVTLVLFCEFGYLLAHVDPPQISPLPPLPNSGKEPASAAKANILRKPPGTASTATTRKPTTEPDEDSYYRRRSGYESYRDRPPEIYSYKRGTDDDKNDADTPTKVTIILKTKIDNTTEKFTVNTNESVSQFSPDEGDIIELTSNTPQNISSVKGLRRSVGDAGKEVDPDNSLLLKIIDDNGKPRLEILIGNDGDTAEKLGKKNRLPRSKTKSKMFMFVKCENNTIVDKAEEFKPTVIKVMPNNSLVVNDPDDLSGYSDDKSYNATDFMEEKFSLRNLNNISRKNLDVSNSNHEIDDNFTNFKTYVKFSYFENPYTIKVRFDNKTEIIRNY